MINRSVLRQKKSAKLNWGIGHLSKEREKKILNAFYFQNSIISIDQLFRTIDFKRQK